jgi:hypothetical protein
VPAGRASRARVHRAILELGSDVGRDEQPSKKASASASFLPRCGRVENKNEKTSRLIAESLDHLKELRIKSRMGCNKEIGDALMYEVLAMLG